MTAVILICWISTVGAMMECDRNSFYWDRHWPIDFRKECEKWIFSKEIEIVDDDAYLAHAICVAGDAT